MKNKKRSIAVLTALACLMSGSSLVYADGAEDVVDSVDASLLLAAAAAVGSGNESGLTEQLEIYADLDDSGAFDANDASTILQYAAESGTGYEGGIDDFLKR